MTAFEAMDFLEKIGNFHPVNLKKYFSKHLKAHQSMPQMWIFMWVFILNFLQLGLPIEPKFVLVCYFILCAYGGIHQLMILVFDKLTQVVPPDIDFKCSSLCCGEKLFSP